MRSLEHEVMKGYDLEEELGVFEEPKDFRYGGNLVLNLCLQFTVDMIEFTEILEAEKKYVIAKQLLRAGGSIGANAVEAQNAESKKHFVSKFKISIREADEVSYWLKVCEASKSYPNPPAELWDKLDHITRIINKIIATTNRNMNDEGR